MKRRNAPRILVVDDDSAHRMMLTTLLADWAFEAEEAEHGERALERIRQSAVDLILMDVRMPVMDGIEATRKIHQYNPAIPIIIMTAYSSIPNAVEALKSGAFDYITKPMDFDALRVVLDRAIEHTRLRSENEELRRQIVQFQIPEMVGNGPAVRRLKEMIALVAPTEATVLISGESGTGKGLLARALHGASLRRTKPLVEVNCAAIPEALIESELFGHEKGAFTGADRPRKGRFLMADGGTLFLDEIGELPMPTQAKLLRVLQDGQVQRVGSDDALIVDVRILAATNRNLENMVKQGTFREDLFYRLNVVAIEAPPLRRRVEDIPVLAQHFLSRFGEKNRKEVKGITPQAMDLLIHYGWPGNIRELENAMERAVILLQGKYVSEKELPAAIQGGVLHECAEGTPFGEASTLQGAGGAATLEEIERNTILQTLRELGGNKSEAARRLGITRRTLKLKLKKYENEETLH